MMMKMQKKPHLSAILVLVLLAITTLGCDLSTLIPAEDLSSGGSGFEISGMAFYQSDNPSLSSDVIGTVSGTNIFVTIPYEVVENDQSLVARFQHNGIVNEDGQAIEPKSNTQFVLYSTDGAKIQTYTMIASLDTASLTYLLLDDPFFYNTDTHTRASLPNTGVTISGGQVKIATPSATYDNFDFNAWLVGFDTIGLPPGATLDNSRLSDGWFLGSGNTGYQVTMTTSSGDSQTYTISLERQLSGNKGISTISADVNEIYDRQLIHRMFDHQYNPYTTPSNYSWNYLNYVQQPNMSYYYTTATYESRGAINDNDRPDNIGDPLPIFPDEGPTPNVDWSTIYDAGSGHQFLISSSVYGHPTTISIPTATYLNSAGYSLSDQSLGTNNKVVSRNTTVNHIITGYSNPPDNDPRSADAQLFFTYNYKQEDIYRYINPRGFYDVRTMYITLQTYADVSSVSLGPAALSYSLSGTPATGVMITITMQPNPSFAKSTGLVATIVIVDEAGDTATETIQLN
jgi:hypothetical protein